VILCSQLSACARNHRHLLGLSATEWGRCRRFSQTIVFEKVRRIGIAAADLTANLFSKLFLISASQKINL
jgi:hypothetical protein